MSNAGIGRLADVNLANVIRVETHWLAPWCGQPWRVAAVDEAGVVLEANRQTLTIDWPQLSAPPQLQCGLLFDALVLTVGSERYTLDWLAGNRAATLQAAIERHWYGFHAQAAGATVERLRRLLEAPGYLRTRRWQQVKHQAGQALSAVTVAPSAGRVAEPVRALFLQLQQWAEWSPDALQSQRDSYLQQQLRRYQPLFDRIESNPLTARQCQACVIDDDNNLVLAGAGTGKTSTLVGRSAYLIESGQARAGQILLLAFGHQAAAEMRQRLQQRLHGEQISARTFHSLGQEIIAKVEGAKPRISVLADDPKRLATQVDSWFEQLLQQPDYRRLAIDYFQHYLFEEKSPFEMPSQGAYYDYLAANEIRSLKGELVKSFEACLIANWLFRMGVEYVYEHPYQQARTRSPDFRPYLADFYLPEYAIYIEHVCMDRQGNTAPYVERDAYHEQLLWQRQLHQQQGTTLIETYHFEQQQGCLLENLRARLQQQGVQFEPLPEEAVLETLREFGAINRFVTLLTQLLGRYKANWFDEQRLRQRIAGSSNPPQVEAAMQLLQPIFARYQGLLKARKEIDFDDMIGRAIDYVQQGRFKPRWRYIMVDEFQDISEPRARLVRALRDASGDCSLFCVGDDWQAIYRFTGSDVSLTSGFEQYFGPSAITTLDKTFRFNNSIAELARRFVTQNPSQLKKQMTTHRQVQQPAVSLLRQSHNSQNPLQPVTDILSAIAARAEPGSRVYLLARFKFRLPQGRDLDALQQAHPSLEIEALSFHAAKGKEADYVVILGLDTGAHGFPSDKVTHPLLEALLPAEESFPYAEERRLFYVALTRARQRVYLACDMATASPFVVELLEQQYPLELNEFDTTLVQTLFEAIRCRRCDSGSLVPRQGRFGAFFGCSNFPRCNHAEKGCQTCGQPMQRQGRFKVCLDQACGQRVPLCPECGAEMTLRQGPRGEFWGCRNYRGQQQPSCDHIEAV